MKSKRAYLVAIIVLVGALGMFNGQANAITLTAYTDLASWQAAVSGTQTLETFNAETVREFDSTFTEYGTSDFNGFWLTGTENGENVGIKHGSNWYSNNGSNFLGYTHGNGNAGPVINFNLDAPVAAFAFDWRDTDWSDEYQLEVAGYTFIDPPSNDSGTGSGFFGVVSTDGFFSTATIRHASTYGGYVDPVAFDNIRTASNPIPEPTTILLFGTGLIGLAGTRRKMKK